MNWIDAPLLIYSQFSDHPAEALVQRELRQGQWASTAYLLPEIYHVLVRDYAAAPGHAAAAVKRLTRTPIHWRPLDLGQVVTATEFWVKHRLQSADALLLHLASEERGTLVTVDRRLLRTAQSLGVPVWNPITPTAAAEVARWEAERFPPKGLSRVVNLVERWLRQRDAALADDFIESTAGLSSLPR
jgi:predicted nucleic acid-binding protein